MKPFSFIFSGAVLIVPVIVLAGCGGGGGGGGPSTPTATPIPTNTPVVLNRVRVLLRDDSGAAVDGLVTIGSARRQSVGGEVTFDNIPLGARTLSVEVGTLVTTQNFTATAGTVTVTVVVRSGVTPGPTGTLPTPPSL